MVWSGKYLLCKREDLSSIPSCHVKSRVWQDMFVTPALGGRHRGAWRLPDCQSQWSVPDVVKACGRQQRRRVLIGRWLPYAWESVVCLCVCVHLCTHMNIVTFIQHGHTFLKGKLDMAHGCEGSHGVKF